MGVTEQRVRQIEFRALNILKEVAEREGIETHR
jgi:DNA-directed RNA polymerase sigma subunit (sigma70/sigma32)